MRGSKILIFHRSGYKHSIQMRFGKGHANRRGLLIAPQRQPLKDNEFRAVCPLFRLETVLAPSISFFWRRMLPFNAAKILTKSEAARRPSLMMRMGNEANEMKQYKGYPVYGVAVSAEHCWNGRGLILTGT